jgi:protein-S-isoprenylcysteine O-methyltransferase Ste14
VLPLVFVWPYALIFWVVYLWTFWPEFALLRRAKRAVAEHTSKDSGSLRLIVVGMRLGLLAAFAIEFFVPSLRFPRAMEVPAFFLGTAVLLAGSLLRRHCRRVLGEYFTGDVQARADQPVVDRGAYHWVRHPSYSGGILMFAGIGLALGNWGSVAVLVLVAAAVYWYRVAVEERALIETIGEPYLAYMRTTKRFVPFII